MTTQQMEMKPASLVLRCGTKVTLMGLTGAPELSGQTGVVLGWDSEAGRYVVRMNSQRAGVGKHKKEKVRPENCIAVTQ